MKPTSLLFVLLLFGHQINAESSASMQFVNTSSCTNLSLSINHELAYAGFPQGSRSSPGHRLPGLIHLLADAGTPYAAVETNLLLESGHDYTVAMTGQCPLSKNRRFKDFPPNRFTFHLLDHAMIHTKPYRFTLINGTITNLNLKSDFFSTNLAVSCQASWAGLPPNLQILAEQNGKSLIAPVWQMPPYRNWIVVFYDTSNGIAYKAVSEKVTAPEE